MDLLDRMNRELVETQSGETESTEEPSPAETGTPPTHSLQEKPCALINWGEIALTDEQLSRIAVHTWSCSPGGVLKAGGARSLVQDEEVIDRAVALSGSGGAIIFVKAWEPPLKDLHDFLVALRNALPDAVPIVIAPINKDRNLEPVPPNQIQLDTWSASIQSMGDPWLSVQPPQEERA
jgi:hypothetical protein